MDRKQLNAKVHEIVNGHVDLSVDDVAYVIEEAVFQIRAALRRCELVDLDYLGRFGFKERLGIEYDPRFGIEGDDEQEDAA